MGRKTSGIKTNTKPQPPPTPRQMLDSVVSERDYQQQIIDYAKLRGYLVYHPYDSRRSAAGFPDLVLAKPGCRLRFLEVKRENGRLSAAQREWLHTLRATGNYARVVRPSDWKVITQMLSNDLQELELDDWESEVAQ